MIDVKKLKELIKLMVANDLTELDLQGEGERVTLKRGAGDAPVHYVSPPVSAAAAPHPTAPQDAAAPATAAASDDQSLVPIRCPMVGTFYAASSPDAEAFVKVGDRVDADTVVCIIEAMKVFNEIKAETSGVIQKVLVETGQAVEFDQPMFMVKATGA